MSYIVEKLKISKLLLTEETLLYTFYILSFLIPFLFKSPQIVVGSIINLILILSVSMYSLKKVIPILLLPSFANYLSGMMFGGATNFLLLLIPSIIAGNLIYVYIYTKVDKTHLKILLSSALKSLFLFLFAYILYKTANLPAIFLTSMGIIQFITATIGATIATLVIKNTTTSK